MTQIKIEVRPAPEGYRYRKEQNRKTRVHFFHEGESVLEGFGNRVARPRDLYKTYLGDVAEELGLPRTTKFRWSQYAGCSCPCSPGFICDDARGKDVFVTLSADAPRTSDDPEKLDEVADRMVQLGRQI